MAFDNSHLQKPQPSKGNGIVCMNSLSTQASRQSKTGRQWSRDEDSWDDDEIGVGVTSLMNGGFSKYLEPLFIYKKRFLAWILCSGLLCWLALLAWPRTYESDCKLQLNVGRESIGLDPSTTTTQTLMMQKTQEEDVNSALELLRSREIAEMVVDEIGAEAILSGYLPSEDGEKQSFFKSVTSSISEFGSNMTYAMLNSSGVRDIVSDRERAINRLTSTTEIFSPKKSSTMIVRSEAKSPEMAQAIARSLTSHFLNKHVNVSTTVGSLPFFIKEAEDAEARMKGLQERRSKMLQTHQIASTESKNTALTTQLASIESTILNTQAQLKRTESEIEDVSNKMKDIELEVVATKQTTTDAGVSGMRSQLYNAELEEKRRMALYTENHPLLVQIRGQVSAGREVLDKLKNESESQSTTPNPIRLKLEEELLRAKTTSVGLDALLKESLAQKEEKEREIRELLDFEVELSQVNRDLDIARTSFVSLREKQEQARVVDNLKNKHISSIAISQPASFIEKPAQPKKILILAAFVMLGLGGGLGLVAIKEMTRTTIRRSDEAERLLGYPVLANVPENRLLANNSSASRKRTYKTLRSKRMDDVYDGCRSIMSELFLGSENGELPETVLGRKIGIVGVRDGCGASSVAMILALESSENEGLRTTLVDLDLRKRTVSNVFGLLGQSSSELIVDNPSTTDFMQHSTRDALSIVGSSSASASKLNVDVREVAEMLRKLAESNDYVIVDLPPANRPANLIPLAQNVDQVVVVVESDTTDARAAEKLISRLEKMNIEIAGIVINKSKRHMPIWLQQFLG